VSGDPKCLVLIPSFPQTPTSHQVYPCPVSAGLPDRRTSAIFSIFPISAELSIPQAMTSFSDPLPLSSSTRDHSNLQRLSHMSNYHTSSYPFDQQESSHTTYCQGRDPRSRVMDSRLHTEIGQGVVVIRSLVVIGIPYGEEVMIECDSLGE
jgi:hypothetical protein